MIYEWNESKNKKNQQKHGVSFEEAVTVFERPDYLLFEDPKVATEIRYLAIGSSLKGNNLLVVHCLRSSKNEEKIRIISARKIKPQEAKALAKL